MKRSSLSTRFYNHRNDRWLAEDPKNVQGVFRTKHTQQIMVLGVFGSDGKKMPPFFFQPDEKIGTMGYYKVLRWTVLPWLKANYPLGNYVWQQDGAPSHTTNKTQNFCSEHMAKFWSKDLWPPSSPDLNTLDYFWWSVIEASVNKTPHPNIQSLKSDITKEWASYPNEEIVKACKAFRPRVEAVIEAGGGHIE